MSEEWQFVSKGVSRRFFVYGAAALLSTQGGVAIGQVPVQFLPDTSALKDAARRSGTILGMYTVMHELLFDPMAAAIIANTFSLVADGNDLKFSNRLRPAPDTFDFSFGDKVVSWAELHGLLFRGHCLIWWNALPGWFQSYVTTANAKQVLSDHVTAVVKHYAGRVYSWDVVNEPIHNDRPDGLRRKPWLDLIGPDYIDIAFHTAHAADPKARLVLNECYIEHDTAAEITRRGQLLALATRLKRAGVPITTIGVQGHLKGNTPLDRPGMIVFLEQIQQLGFEIMITELDVDDVDVSGSLIDQTVASKYAEFIDLMGPFVKVVTFEAVRDYPELPRRSDGLMHRPNLLDPQFNPTPAYTAAVKAMMKLPQRSGT